MLYDVTQHPTGILPRFRHPTNPRSRTLAYFQLPVQSPAWSALARPVPPWPVARPSPHPPPPALHVNRAPRTYDDMMKPKHLGPIHRFPYSPTHYPHATHTQPPSTYTFPHTHFHTWPSSDICTSPIPIPIPSAPAHSLP